VSPSAISSCKIFRLAEDLGAAAPRLVDGTILYTSMAEGIAYRFGAIGWLDTRAIKEEADRCRSFALPLAESIHQLLQGGSSLDLEKDLIVVIGDFDVEMFALAGALRLLGCTRASVVV